MTEVPYAEEKWPTYENFIARCPLCGFENVFNRASDLKDLKPIAHRQVCCLNPDCVEPFVIDGDLVNAAYEMLIHDCYELLRTKHYAHCILSLAQAFEIFFSQYLRVELLYKPFAQDSRQGMEDIERLNALGELLYNRTRKSTFASLRNLFFHQVLQHQPTSLQEAEASIKALPPRPSEPPNGDIKSVTDKKLSTLLMRLKSCKVGELRNKVVHARAYRPTLEEVNEALREVRGIIFPLAQKLGVKYDDINWYTAKVARD